jgi:hypothetical protein
VALDTALALPVVDASRLPLIEYTRLISRVNLKPYNKATVHKLLRPYGNPVGKTTPVTEHITAYPKQG